MIDDKFREQFGMDPEANFVSPGRINLIGEHIDYCGGLVMPMAIDRSTRAAVRRNGDAMIRIYTARFAERREIPLEQSPQFGDWRDFVVGLLVLMKDKYDAPQGVDVYVEDDLGAGGLSSSASFSLLLAHVLIWSSRQSIGWSREQRLALAKLCQQVEHDFVGVQCGIMDQASVALGGLGMLDCATLSYDPLPSQFGEYTLVVMDTRSPRTLASSKYNERVKEIRAIEAALGAKYKFTTLCDLPTTVLEQADQVLGDETLVRRLRHIITEHARVQSASHTIAETDMLALGKLMDMSHRSLRVDYEVTGDALDNIVRISREHEACIGARMIGAGFGGCALALVKSVSVKSHNQWVMQEYGRLKGIEPILFAVDAAPGAGQLSS